MTKISSLTAVTTTAADDTLPVVQGGVTKKATVQQYLDDGILTQLSADEEAWVTAGETGGALGTAAYADTGDFDAAGSAAAAQAAAIAASDPVGTAAALVDDLSGVTNAATARTNLGLGTIATAAAGDYHLTSAFSAAPTAAEPLKADGSGGVRPKKLAVGAALQSGAVMSAHYNAGASLAFYIRESDGKSFWAAPGGFALGGGVYPLAIAHDGAAAAITNSVGDLRIYNTAAGAIRFRTSNAARLAIEDTTITASVSITPASLADAAAPNGTLYYSTTAGKLVFKDSGGTVNNLY